MSCKVNFLNIPIDAITMSETVEIVEDAIKHKTQILHTVINAGKVVLMQKDKELEESVLNADIINADGQAIVWAASFLGKSLPERVAGIDLMQNLVRKSFEKGYKCFFFGAEEKVVSNVVEKYSKLYSKNIIAGYRNGFYNSNDEENIVKEIVYSEANILFVAMSSPKKEIFLDKFRMKLKHVNFIMGVGGSFDVISGDIIRAPLFMQKIGFEWFYRFLQEPKRMWKRYLFGNINFIYLVIKKKFSNSTIILFLVL